MVSDRFRHTHLMLSALLLFGGAGTGVALLVLASPASAIKLPNPCSILASTHAANTIEVGRHLVVGKISIVNTHYPPVRECEQRVGSILVHLEIGTGTGGYGGETTTSLTHPSGLGSNVTLVVGKLLARNGGGAYDLIYFKKARLWTSIWADGASPRALTTLARKIYKVLPGPSLSPSSTSTVPTTTTTTIPVAPVASPAIAWQAIGPAGFANYIGAAVPTTPTTGLTDAGKIGAVAIDFANPLVMFVGAAGGDNRGPLSEAGIYATTDGGKTWTTADHGLTNTEVNDIRLSQSSPQDLLAATQGGIFRSTDSGSTWVSVSQAATVGFASIGSTIYAGTSSGVESSTDLGSTWTPVKSTPYPVTAISAASNTLYVADESSLLSDSPSSGWQTIFTAAPSSGDWISWVVGEPTNPDNIYFLHCPPGQPGGPCTRTLSASSDGGRTWTQLMVPTTYQSKYLNAQALAMDLTQHDVLYVGGNEVFSESTDGGQQFTQTDVSIDIWFLQSWPGRAGTLVAGTDQGVYLITNGGQTWTSLNGNLTTSLLYNISVAGSTILASAQDNSPFLSFDGGTSWSSNKGAGAPKGEGGEDLIDPLDPQIVLALGGCCGLQVSHDGGHTFTRSATVTPSLFNQNSQGIAVSSSGAIYVATSNGIYVSRDNGQTFETTGWPISRPSFVVFGPSGTGFVFVGTADTGLLMYSSNDGTTWQTADLSGASGYPTTLAYDPANPSIVLLGMSAGPQLGGGLLISSNGGRSFAFANTGILPIQQYTASTNYPAIWQISFEPGTALALAATTNGLYALPSLTGSWISLQGNAVPQMFTGIAWSGANVFVSTMGEGVLRTSVAALSTTTTVPMTTTTTTVPTTTTTTTVPTTTTTVHRSVHRTTITCVRRATRRRVTAVRPRCPSGYRRVHQTPSHSKNRSPLRGVRASGLGRE